MKMSMPRIVFYSGLAMMAAGLLLMLADYGENAVKIFALGIFIALLGFVLYLLREFRKSGHDYKLGMMER